MPIAPVQICADDIALKETGKHGLIGQSRKHLDRLPWPGCFRRSARSHVFLAAGSFLNDGASAVLWPWARRLRYERAGAFYPIGKVDKAIWPLGWRECLRRYPVLEPE